MDASLKDSTAMVPESLSKAAKQTRASRPKVRTGCLTCKARKIKCDEGKPACTRCINAGRVCDGYSPLKSSVVMPKPVTPVTAPTSPMEPRVLEFFFQKSAPQLAGFLEGGFFQGTVLQLSLAEPAIRQAIAAIGALHEQGPFGLQSASSGMNRWPLELPIQLYNRAIRSIIDKAASDPNHSTPVIATASILFTCFECFQGNAAASVAHIQNGIKLLQAWRAGHGGEPAGPWGQRYSSFESQFMETEVAPLLSLFNANSAEFSPGRRPRILLNAMDDQDGVHLADHFETLREARIALVDLITAASCFVVRYDSDLRNGRLPELDIFRVCNLMQNNFICWKANFEDMVRRCAGSWNKQQQHAADVIRIMSLSADIGLRFYQVNNESDWDHYRPDFECLFRLVESIISDPDRYPDELSKTLSLDFGVIFPFHGVAWKCRWPHLRRRALDLLQRVPKREWMLDTEHYHAIFSRIMEIEEEHLHLAPGTVPDENVLPPESVRIHDFEVTPLPAPPGGSSLYALTFWSKPHGPDGAWRCQTEHMRLTSSLPGEAAVPINLISCKQWAMPELINSSTVDTLKSVLCGPEVNRRSPNPDPIAPDAVYDNDAYIFGPGGNLD
ncbi:hypothetical protein NUU61_002761 [Penicillium alfredii]|uniref:Zn(2)-C6 fungal-type domain-containing protein n=1 Tax=Penicillium alfredii TaxID=1506179 RepID=A0A9W9FS48_9EURO|nr:uncharacterized protein NUU61_002761 [Penicillium alfredii]KAJ5105414.1 hypothetical protein NUU61_002761 [Penicillium alfredii]